MTDKQILKWVDQMQGELDALKKLTGGGGGGGGSHKLTYTELWSSDTGVSGAAQNITLSEDIFSFDFIAFLWGTSIDGGLATAILTPNPQIIPPDGGRVTDYPSYSNRFVVTIYDKENPNVLNIQTGQYGEQAGYTPIIYKVYGLKY